MIVGTIYMQVMIDIWLYAWPVVYLTIALIDLVTVHLCLACYFNLILYISFIACPHNICTYTFLFILHTNWVAFWWPWICTFRLDILFHWSGMDELVRFARPGVSSHSILVFLLLLYSDYFLILSLYIGLHAYSFLLWSCVDIYMSYCSDINLSL